MVFECRVSRGGRTECAPTDDPPRTSHTPASGGRQDAEPYRVGATLSAGARSVRPRASARIHQEREARHRSSPLRGGMCGGF